MCECESVQSNSENPTLGSFQRQPAAPPGHQSIQTTLSCPVVCMLCLPPSACFIDIVAVVASFVRPSIPTTPNFPAPASVSTEGYCSLGGRNESCGVILEIVT
jgi:hypothetical protein